MFCKNCGSEIDNNAYVCPECGVRCGAEVAKRNTIGLLGFIFSFIVPLVGLILSIIGYNKANELDGDRKELSKAGIIISAVLWIANFVISIVYGSLILSALA